MQKINLNLSHPINPSDTGSQSGNGSFRLQGNAQITNATNTKTSNNSKPLISQQIPMYEQDKPVASGPVSSNDGKVMNTYGTANSAQNSDPMRLSLDDSNTDVIQIQLYCQDLFSFFSPASELSRLNDRQNIRFSPRHDPKVHDSYVNSNHAFVILKLHTVDFKGTGQLFGEEEGFKLNLDKFTLPNVQMVEQKWIRSLNIGSISKASFLAVPSSKRIYHPVLKWLSPPASVASICYALEEPKSISVLILPSGYYRCTTLYCPKSVQTDAVGSKMLRVITVRSVKVGSMSLLKTRLDKYCLADSDKGHRT
ncbi:hypothetical protein K435DRAFT_798733 [Dendrothele bispora CBS 962.96]|uniref:Uncharacterized protein n=1 Tax=Dendrothele bispora (strain CBS 962.96) TaxID=1314807 RepID=A0A4S8LY84_DENBC|nr:hypothetical protein K435DRAFT_798733 [Dendrothele bispora CBS 962.96]